MAAREGQVIEVLFDADQWLSPADWATPEPLNPITHHPLHISLPYSRRCSTSSTISCASPIQLSPTLATSFTVCYREVARETSPRATTSFSPCSRGFHAASLFLAGAPGAEDAVRNARNMAVEQIARELKLAKKLAPRSNPSKAMATVEWMGKAAEMTQTLQISRLRDETGKAEKSVQTGLLMGIRRRFA